jgi:hypothetical protein
MNHDDINVAEVLNLPVLGEPSRLQFNSIFLNQFLNVKIKGCEPEIANLYTTKSGSKRIFQSAKVAMPHGEFDIYNKGQVS